MTALPQSTLTGIVALLDANPMFGAPPEGGKRFWTGRECKVIRDTYPKGGVPACLPLLPGRSASAIYAKAGQLGLKADLPTGHKHRLQKWTSNEHIDRLIRDTYQRTPQKNDVMRLAKTIGRPSRWVGRRARALGLLVPRFKEPPWTEREHEIVAEFAHRRPHFIRSLLAREGFGRSETAIINKLKRLGVSRADDPNFYSARGLATLMGVDGRTVTRWIENGWLKAKRKGTERVEAQGGDLWWIHRRDVRAFVAENTAAVDLRKVDKFWFIDLLLSRAGEA